MVDDVQPTLQEVLSASRLPETVATPLEGDAMAVTVHRLSNGMTVYLSPDHGQPRVTAWVGVRAGSRMDPADSTGLAHYLEHMLFKGTDEFGTIDMDAERRHVEAVAALYRRLRTTNDPDERTSIFAAIDRETQAQGQFAIPNEIDRMYAAIGATGVNAFTSDEETVYIANVPSNQISQWATIEAERYTDPVFRLFWPELEAVYEEKNLDLDDPNVQAWYAMLEGLFPEHPYGTQTTIGEVDHLKSPAYDDMVEFFERWYVPNNMAIALAGDVDESAVQMLEERFGHLEPSMVKEVPAASLPPVSGRVQRDVVGDGEPGVRIAWQTVPAGHPDEAALTVLDRVLDDARVGVLNTRLELTQKLPAAGSGHTSLGEAGYFYVWTVARQEQSLQDVEAMVGTVLDELRGGGVTQADVDAAKLHWRLERTERLESSPARASALMDAFITHREWSDVVAFDRAVAAVTHDDVVRVANTYLGDDRVVVFKTKGNTEVPKLDKPSITPVAIDPSRKSPFFERVEAMETPALEPVWTKEGVDYERRSIPSGALIVANNPRNDLFSITIRVPRGYRKAPLLCHALALFELSGRGGASAESLQKELYALGSSVWTSCDADESLLRIEGVDENLDATVELVLAWIDDPTFDDALVARHLSNTLSQRRDQLDQDAYLTAALDAYAKHGDDSAWKRAPSNAMLAAATPATLKRLIRTFLDVRGQTLYFGTRSADDAAALLGARRNSAGRTRFSKAGPIRARSFRRLERSQLYFLHKDVAKASIRFAFARPPLPRADRPLAELYSHVLSGNMSSAVFQELRESSGLAYSAYAGVSAGRTPRDASALLGSLSTQADKTAEALTRFVAMLRSPPLSPARLAEARAALDQEYRASRVDPRSLPSTVLAWDDRGEPADPRPWQRAQIQAAGADTLQTFAASWTQVPVVFAVVGDRDRVDLDALAPLGTVIEVSRETLFGYGPFPDGFENAP